MNRLKSLMFQDVSKARESLRRFHDRYYRPVPFAIATMGVLTLALVITACSLTKTVTVNDDGQSRTMITLSRSVDHILTDAGVALQDDDIVSASLTGGDSYINIERAFDVSITVDGGDPTVVRMTGGTVTDALAMAGVSLETYEVTNRDDCEPLEEGSAIRVEKTEYTDRVVTEPIDYASTTRHSAALATGQRKVTQKGVKGERTYVYRDYLENGVVVKTELISETLSVQPVNEIITVGIKAMSAAPMDIELNENGVPVNYKTIVTGTACAYTTPQNNRGITSTGTVPCVGTVAVNPKIIPYGSKLYIVSDNGYVYGYGIASDTGGDLLNNNIIADLYMDTTADCYEFGRRSVKIYILE